MCPGGRSHLTHSLIFNDSEFDAYKSTRWRCRSRKKLCRRNGREAAPFAAGLISLCIDGAATQQSISYYGEPHWCELSSIGYLSSCELGGNGWNRFRTRVLYFLPDRSRFRNFHTAYVILRNASG